MSILDFSPFLYSFDEYDDTSSIFTSLPVQSKRGYEKQRIIFHVPFSLQNEAKMRSNYFEAFLHFLSDWENQWY